MTGRRAAPSGRLAARALGTVLVAAAALAAGCAGIAAKNLPPEPIALIYRTSEQAKDLAKLMEPREKREEDLPRPGYSVLRADSVLEYLSGQSGRERMRESAGRMMFLDPHTLHLTAAPVVRAGARPLEWSPDHRILRFTSLRDGPPQVYEYDRDAGQLLRLTSGDHPEAFASVSPDGRLAFSRVLGSRKQPRSRIYVRDLDGQVRALTAGPADFRPVWSRDGRFLLYSTLIAGRHDAVARVDPDGGAPRIIARGKDPVFTPDGEWVVYVAEVNGTWELWRMLPNGAGKRAIGGASAIHHYDAATPAVSPDGRFVVYVSEEQGRHRLRIRRLDGSGDRLLLEAGDAVNPVW